MNKSKLKEFVKRTLEAMDSLPPSKKGVSPDKLKHFECPKCKNPVTTLKSIKPPMWGCDKCKHTWEESVNEEHGDTHYWGAQPKDKEYKISTGYKDTIPIKESTKNLKDLIIEAAKEVVLEIKRKK